MIITIITNPNNPEEIKLQITFEAAKWTAFIIKKKNSFMRMTVSLAKTSHMAGEKEGRKRGRIAVNIGGWKIE